MNDFYQRLSVAEQRKKRLTFQNDENYNILSAAFDSCKQYHGLSSPELWDEIMSLRESLMLSVRRDLEVTNYPEELCERYRFMKDCDGSIHERTQEEASNTAFFVAHGLIMCLVAKGDVDKNPHKDLIFSLMAFTKHHPLHDDFVHRIQYNAEDTEEKKGYHYIARDYLSTSAAPDLAAAPLTDIQKADELQKKTPLERRFLAFAIAVNRIQEKSGKSPDIHLEHQQEWGIILRCAYALHLIKKENDNTSFINLLQSLDIIYKVNAPESTHLSKYTGIVEIKRTPENKIQWQQKKGADEVKFRRSFEVWKQFLEYFNSEIAEHNRLLSLLDKKG